MCVRARTYTQVWKAADEGARLSFAISCSAKRQAHARTKAMVHQKASQAAWLQPLPVRRVLAIRRLPFNQSSAAEHLPPETSVAVRLDFSSRPAATSRCCTIYFPCKHGRRHRLYFEDVQHSGALPKARLGRDYDLNAWSIEATCSFLSCLGLGQTARRGDSDYQSAAQSSTIHGPSSCYTQSLQQCHRTNPAPGSRFTQLQEHSTFGRLLA